MHAELFEQRVSVPGQPPDIAFRGRQPAPEDRMKEVVGFVRLVGHESGGRPVGHVGGVGRVVDRPNLLAIRSPARGIVEEGAGRVAGPRVLRSDPADDPGQLDPGVINVLVPGTLGPEPAADKTSAGSVDADLASGVQAAKHLVDAEHADTPSEEAEPIGPVPQSRLGKLSLSIQGRRGEHQCGQRRASHAPHQKVTSIPTRSRRGSPM